MDGKFTKCNFIKSNLHLVPNIGSSSTPNIGTINDFMDSTLDPKIQEARYQYFMKRKKVKMDQLKEVIHEQKRKKNQSFNDDLKNGTVSRRPRINSTLSNLDMTEQSSPRKQSLIESPTEEKMKSKAFITVDGRENVSPPKKKELTPTLSVRLIKAPSQLDVSQLVVNQEPEIPLKVELNRKTPELFLNQKIQNLEKMNNAKDKLEVIMENDKQKFEKKLSKRRRDVVKLKELIDYEDQERNQKISMEELKRQRALKKYEQINKEIEKKQYQYYKEYLNRVKKEKEDKEIHKKIEHLEKVREIQEIKMKDEKLEHDQLEKMKKEHEDVEQQLVSLNRKLQEKSVMYEDKLNTVKKSRNFYSQKIEKVRTEFQEKRVQDDIQKLQYELSRFNQLLDKRERVYEEKRELSENLQKYNTERLLRKKQQRNEIEKQREKWSYSILQKHKKQWDQVLERHNSLENKMRVKREYSNLKREDHSLNYTDVIEDLRKKQFKIQNKHQNLSQSLKTSKKQMEDLQLSQRVTEVQKKIEMYNDYWNQTLKPRNKLIDVSFKKQILNPEPIIRSKAPIINIKLVPNDD